MVLFKSLAIMQEMLSVQSSGYGHVRTWYSGEDAAACCRLLCYIIAMDAKGVLTSGVPFLQTIITEPSQIWEPLSLPSYGHQTMYSGSQRSVQLPSRCRACGRQSEDFVSRESWVGHRLVLVRRHALQSIASMGYVRNLSLMVSSHYSTFTWTVYS